MNIAILVAGLPPDAVGGAERQAAELARRLAARHTVRIFTRTGTVPEELRRDCLVVERCRVKTRGVRFGADIVLTLARIGRARRSIDVIVAYQTVIDGLIGVLAGMLFRIPVIVSVRSDTEYQLDRFVQSRLFSPFVFRHADRIAVQSSTLGDELVRALDRPSRRPTAAELRGKLLVLPNGIDAISRRSTDGEGILYVGNLTAVKGGVDVLIEAMRDLPDEHLTIVGDGPEKTALEHAARGLPNVEFAGVIPHGRVGERLAATKLLVLPSRHEGQPNIVLEAMARGVPVIATRVGGLPDLIAHGQSGWLIDVGDAAALASAVRRLSSDSSLRARFAENGARAMQAHHWPAIVGQFERALEDVVAARRNIRGSATVRES